MIDTLERWDFQVFVALAILAGYFIVWPLMPVVSDGVTKGEGVWLFVAIVASAAIALARMLAAAAACQWLLRNRP